MEISKSNLELYRDSVIKLLERNDFSNFLVTSNNGGFFVCEKGNYVIAVICVIAEHDINMEEMQSILDRDYSIHKIEYDRILIITNQNFTSYAVKLAKENIIPVILKSNIPLPNSIKSEQFAQKNNLGITYEPPKEYNDTVKCKVCGHSMASHAVTCPFCGSRYPEHRSETDKAMSALRILIGIIIFILVWFLLFGCEFRLTFF